MALTQTEKEAVKAYSASTNATKTMEYVPSRDAGERQNLPATPSDKEYKQLVTTSAQTKTATRATGTKGKTTTTKGSTATKGKTTTTKGKTTTTKGKTTTTKGKTTTTKGKTTTTGKSTDKKTTTTKKADPKVITPGDITKKQDDMQKAGQAEYDDFLKKAYEGQVAQQQAELERARDKQLSDLEEAYKKAVNEGEVSVREAQDMFTKQKEEIDKQAYLDSQMSAMNAQNMGVQNSMQYVAMQQGDNIHRADNTNDAMSERDSRISGIRDRLKQLGSDKDKGVIDANSNFDYTMAGVKGKAQSDMAMQQAQMRQQALETSRNQTYQLDMAQLQQMYANENLTKQQKFELERMAKAQGYDLKKMAQQQKYDKEKMKTQHGYDKDNMKTQQGYDKEKMKIGQKYTLEQYAKAYGYDVKKMNLAQRQELAKMAKQQGYTISNMEAQQANTLEQFAVQNGYKLNEMSVAQQYQLAEMAQKQGYDLELADVNYGYQKQLNDQQLNAEVTKMQKQIELQSQKELQDYDLAVTRELAKYKKGSKEYKIRQGQLNTEREGLLAEMATKTQFDVLSKSILNGETKKPKKPTQSWWETDSHYKKEKKEYQAKLKSYERYLKFKNNPLSAMP